VSVPDDPGVTPNPDRAIWVKGQLNEALLDRLRSAILVLTARNREPITLFVNSSGGQPEVAEGILSLLRRTTQDDARASRIITVAAPKAVSAAANLLSAGDFAIAHPNSTLLYHGGRWPLAGPITGDLAKLLAQTLPIWHERSAAALARTSVHRFLFIVSAHRELFARHRADAGDATLSDVNCFQAILRGKVSPAAQKVVERAMALYDGYNGLLLHFQKRLRRGRTVTKAHLQKLMHYASIDFEYGSNKDNPAWDGRLGRITDHVYFLNAYFDLRTLCDWIAARPEPQTAEAAADDSLQFRLFFLALCRALQEGENYITPVDALWLGLIDTVRADLASP
jgi:ATP-dependent protease ClpP protease subunit